MLWDIIFRGVFPRYFRKDLFDARRASYLPPEKAFSRYGRQKIAVPSGDAVDGAETSSRSASASPNIPANRLHCHSLPPPYRSLSRDRLRYSQAIDHMASLLTDRYGGAYRFLEPQEAMYRTFRSLYRLHLAVRLTLYVIVPYKFRKIQFIVPLSASGIFLPFALLLSAHRPVLHPEGYHSHRKTVLKEEKGRFSQQPEKILSPSQRSVPPTH